MRSARQVPTLVLVVWLIAGHCFAFDTGSHSDMTRTVLREHSFDGDSIKVVQVENWLTDYYSNSPTYSRERRAVLEKLHFDNLFTTAQVDDYWAFLTNNLKTAAENAAREDDKLEMLVIIGIGLHAVQDFYAHSNWIETHPRTGAEPYRSDTYLGSNATSPIAVTAIHTGKYPADRTSGPWKAPIPLDAELHGGYDAGLNHDSPIRPLWDEAYIFAYCASHELIDAFAKWSEAARPGFWERVKTYAAAPEQKKRLDNDVLAARNISMWFKGEGQDGHWKGNKSGTTRFFSAFSGKWVAGDSSVFVRAMRDGRIQDRLTADLYSGKKAPLLPVIDKYSLKRRTILFRSVQIAESGSMGIVGKLPGVGTHDYYSRVVIAGQDFWSRTIQQSRKSDDPWMEMCIIDQDVESVSITVSVFDENSLDGEDDHPVDINPSSGKSWLDLGFRISDSMITGDLSGIFDSRARSFTVSGAKPDDHRAVLRAFVNSNVIR
jgi:hypothetical protein